MPTALVTGATAGLGAEFARRLAAEGQDLVLVARDKARLDQRAEELRGRYGVQVEVLAADLADDAGCTDVETRLGDSERPVDVLVNNAGFALPTGFVRSSADDEDRMLQVLVRAVVRLTHAAAEAMATRGRGEIVNVSSVAGFIPGGTYSAAKTYVTAFTESVAAQLRRRGVRICAVCPGYTHTEFHQRAQVDKGSIPSWMWLDAERVVDEGLRDLRKGVVVSIPSRRYKAISALVRHVPRALLRRVVAR
jgi:uncharacterized protein